MKEITLACEAFQKLLEEQLERIRNMNGEKTDFSTKKQVTIGVIDGDGIGPVITAQATRVLEKLLAEEIAAGSIVIKQIEGLTIDILKTGKARAVRVDTLNKLCRALDCQPGDLLEYRPGPEDDNDCLLYTSTIQPRAW